MSDLPFIPIIKPWMDEREVAAAGRAILSGWITQGPEVEAFERELATYVGAKHAVAVSNCTTALHLALLAVGVRTGDEVVTVSHSFIATTNAIRYCGATPVFVDVEPGTFNMDPSRLEAAIGQKTRAIMVVHQMGMPANLSEIVAIARAKGLRVVEDAACATGSEVNFRGSRAGNSGADAGWEKIGRPHGDVACFSFHPRKVMSTGDGGMLTTNDAKMDGEARLLRQHGMSVPDRVRHASNVVTFESYPIMGFNYRMTDIQAAVGRVQLERMPTIVARRRELASRYASLIRERTPSVGLPVEPAYARSNWQSYCIRLPKGSNQRKVMQGLLDRKIATRRGIMCAHREEASAGAFRIPEGETLCESELAQEECVILPLYHQMTNDDLERVVDGLKTLL